ncbi:hypothetical protein CYG48_08955 [Neorhizobium sp. SOG26]|uniref:Arc family DNA-binding protein n=1 Tax=Neorhizobium sp. SOG26 TaxID=2060726 RepID=UPI000E58CD15|nr:Arc family DNA-binding protein [Neorhizobium sp. SOG26]AXV15813.1 hypothetical protein CYG48_08955 [Neorhizobium sp. SOG26]
MARPSYPSDEVDKLLLRFPPGLRDSIKEKAEENGRSLNAEIIHRLQSSLQGLGQASTLDEIAHRFLTRFATGSYVPGQTEKFNDLYLSAKRLEAEAIRKLMDGAQSLLAKADERQQAADIDAPIDADDFIPMQNVFDRKKD